jgi:hypothetical protein
MIQIESESVVVRERGRIPMKRVEPAGEESRSELHASPGRIPVHMTWTDPQDGEELWIEMWGSRDFVDELLAQGFEIRTLAEDETLSSLCVRIMQDGS